MTYEEWAACRGFNTALLREAWQASRQQALEEAAALFESRYTEYFPEHISAAIRSLTTTGERT